MVATFAIIAGAALATRLRRGYSCAISSRFCLAVDVILSEAKDLCNPPPFCPLSQGLRSFGGAKPPQDDNLIKLSALVRCQHEVHGDPRLHLNGLAIQNERAVPPLADGIDCGRNQHRVS